MHGCDIIFTPEVAEQVKEQVSKHSGGTCPCEDGRTCPLLPPDGLVPLEATRLENTG